VAAMTHAGTMLVAGKGVTQGGSENAATGGRWA
jgi:hypothetical protein